MKKKTLFTLICVCFIILSACSKKSDKQIANDPKPDEKELYVTPFSGKLVEEEVTMRPIIVTVNNHPDARPQSGLSSADVVYEMLAEGDVTRFLALFQSDIPSNIGPVRSARSYFIEIAKGLDAFYIAHGYSPEAKVMLKNRVVDNINGMQYDGTLFKRSKDRVAPHNSYIPGENIKLGAEKANASLLYQKKVSYTYYGEDEDVLSGTPINDISVIYSSRARFNSNYHYNSESNKYTKSSDGKTFTDLLSGEPLQLSNILIFESKHSFIDKQGRRDIDIESGGRAYLFQAGTMREVEWKNIDGVLKAVEDDGSEVKLLPGQTWIHFVPTQPGITSSVKYS